MDLVRGTRDLWNDNKEEIEKKLEVWAKVLKAGGESLALTKKEFHQWSALRAYISKSDLKSDLKTQFSLRFLGQEVAKLLIKDKVVKLQLKGHEERNKRWFKLEIKDDIYDWHGGEAKKFRSHFLKITKSINNYPKVYSPEHRVESMFLDEMKKGSGKFGGKVRFIQPVLIAKKIPLQIPLPISASSGMPKFSDGHIDILARRNGRLSLWELKKPNIYGTPAAQALIYAYTLLLILRNSKSKDDWYKLFGFTDKKIPNKLTIEAVVAITKDQMRKFNKEKEKLEKDNNFPLIVGKDRIELYVAYYKEELNSIKLEENPFMKKI